MVKKMLKKIKKEEIISIIIFCLGFLIFLSYNLADNNITYDKIWTFHMTQKVAMGEIPYTEINMIITPFFYQLGALLFNITGQANLFMYSVYGGLIGAFIMLMCYKLIKEITKNEFLSIVATCLMTEIISIVYETNYNLLLLGLILSVILFEIRKEKSDKKTKYNIFIGILLGLCAATKHTVGGITLLISLILPIIKKIYLKEEKVCLKEITNKLIGIAIVGVPYFVWLILAGNLKDFIDLAILGMFDFAEKNTIGTFFNVFSLMGTSAVFASIMLFYTYKKENKCNKEWLIIALYAIVAMTYSVPLFNFFHVFISNIIPMVIIMCIVINFGKDKTKNTFLIMLVAYTIFKVIIAISTSQIVSSDAEIQSRWSDLLSIRNSLYYIFVFLIVFSTLINKVKVAAFSSTLAFIIIPLGLNMYMWKTNVKENNKYYIYEYSCIGVKNEVLKDVQEINQYVLEKEKEGYKVLILDIDASKYMVPLHRNNYKYDLILNGNLGYNGEERLISEINDIENLLILRQKPEKETIDIQQSEGVDKYIEQNYKRIGEINDLEIYN